MQNTVNFLRVIYWAFAFSTCVFVIYISAVIRFIFNILYELSSASVPGLVICIYLLSTSFIFSRT